MVYEYPTNYSNGTEVTGPGGFFLDWPVSIASNYGNALILLIWLFSFAITARWGSSKAILVSSFITGIFAVFFAVRGWINQIIPFVLIIMVIVALFFSRDSVGGL